MLHDLRTFGLIALLATSLHSQIPSGIALTPAFGSGGSGAFGRLAFMDELPGRPGHFLVAEFAGKIWLLTPGAGGHTRSLFATIPINTLDEDQQLSPFCFHPDFLSNRKYYVRRGDAGIFPRGLRLEEREAAADGLKDSGKPPRTLMTVVMPGEFADHNGGGLAFGPDGYLYIGIGDGGWDQKTPDAHNNGQNRESLLGKILRIDVNRKDPELEYAIPKDNPFISDANPKVRREIYAYGVRNPFRMSFDRLTGELYVGDVGLFNFEKINIVKKGANYGWRLQEHTLCYTPGTCNNITVDPPAGYMTFGPVKCFVGGQTYRGNPASPFYGVHIFGDHTMKRLLAFKKGSGPVIATDIMATPMEMTAFTLDSQNNVYMIGYRGTIYKLEHKDLTPYASAIRPAGRQRLEVLTGSGWYPLPRGPVAIFRLDGSRLGTLDAKGLGKNRLPSHPTGLILTVPAR